MSKKVSSFDKDTRTAAIGILANMAINENGNAEELLNLYLTEYSEEQTLLRCYASLLQCTQDLAIYASIGTELGTDLFQNLALSYAMGGVEDDS
jgi:hypothetical protein